MVTRRLCAFRFPTGEPCHSPPLRDGDYCLMHSPEHAKEVQEARRIGGLHRNEKRLFQLPLTLKDWIQ